MKEIWKKIPDFKGYEASNKGRIRSFYFKEYKGWRYGTVSKIGKNPHVIKRVLNSRGYLYVTLRASGKQLTKAVHQCVLLAFRGKKPEGFCGRHLDGNKENCALGNLKWDTYKANIADKKTHGTEAVGSARASAKLTEREVRLILKLLKKGIYQSRIAEKFNVSVVLIGKISKGEIWLHVKRDPEYRHEGNSGGERNPQHKLTERNVRRIRALLANGESQRKIAEHFKVCPQTISGIMRGLTWTSVK